MRIRSRFKDYYDAVLHCYGADPDVFFDRKEHLPEHAALPVLKGYADKSFAGWSGDAFLSGDARRTGWEMAFVVAGSIVEPTMERHGFGFIRPQPEELLDLARHGDALQYEARYGRSRKGASRRIPGAFPASEVEAFVRAVGSPVFRVLGIEGGKDGRRFARIDSCAPILKNIVGFSARHPPEEVWQSVYTALVSVLRTDLDRQPPAKVDERTRIEYAGFDLKTSFRHPVNSPAAAAAKRRAR